MVINQKIDAKLLSQAIKVLRELNENHNKSSKKKLLLEDENEPAVYLQISLKKIPKFKDIKMIKMHLPHSLFKENKEACLITGDLDKRNKKAEIEPDVLHYKELLKKHGINNVSEVVTLRQLRTEYKPYEAKQKLLAAYDVFLADRKIVECLPRVLGRHFFKKRKFPIQITLNTPNLKEQVEKGLSTKVFYLTGHGNSCNSEVAYLDMSDQEISENVLEMAKSVCDKLPGSWDNVMGIYLKTALSKAIPVYISYGNPKINIEDEPTDNSFEIDELSTCPNSLVKVYSDGRVHTVRMKRMAETETYETSDVSGKSEKKKKKEESVIDNNELGDNSNLATANLNDETADVSGKSEKKKKKKKNVTDNVKLDNNRLATEDLNDETADVSGKSEKKKKKKESVIDNRELGDLATADLDGESNQSNKKSRNCRKSMRNTLSRDDESTINTKLKGKQKKRKSLVNNV